MEHLIDPTTGETILRHLDVNPEIDLVVIVSKEYPLATIGKIFNEGTDANTQKFENMYKEGNLSIYGKKELPKLTEKLKRKTVNCLYLPPVYLIQLIEK